MVLSKARTVTVLRIGSRPWAVKMRPRRPRRFVAIALPPHIVRGGAGWTPHLREPHVTQRKQEPASTPASTLARGQALANCVLGQLGDGPQTQLFGDLPSVRLDRWHRDTENNADLFGGLALGHQLQHLALPDTQRPFRSGLDDDAALNGSRLFIYVRTYLALRVALSHELALVRATVSPLFSP